MHILEQLIKLIRADSQQVSGPAADLSLLWYPNKTNDNLKLSLGVPISKTGFLPKRINPEWQNFTGNVNRETFLH